jgi:hypothetical protein
MRRFVLYAAAPACLLLGLPVAAQADLAPPGTASATAAQIGSLVGVSTTGAAANSDTAGARASVLDLNGEPLLGTGGSQASTGESSGALVDTGNALPVTAQVAPWSAAASGSASDSTRTSKASAAVARAEVPSVAKLGVLQSESAAEHQSTKSTAVGSSDAIDLGLADIAELVLLHSEVRSEGAGHSYLVGLNGTEIGTDDQLGQLCALQVPDVVALSCLTATGGLGSGGLLGGNAEVLGASIPLASALDPVSAFNASATSGTGSVVSGATETPAAATEAERSVAPAAAATAPGVNTLGQALPRTGVAIAALFAAALAALLSGGALRLLGRRRVTA